MEQYTLPYAPTINLNMPKNHNLKYIIDQVITDRFGCNYTEIHDYTRTSLSPQTIGIFKFKTANRSDNFFLKFTKPTKQAAGMHEAAKIDILSKSQQWMVRSILPELDIYGTYNRNLDYMITKEVKKIRTQQEVSSLCSLSSFLGYTNGIMSSEPALKEKFDRKYFDSLINRNRQNLLKLMNSAKDCEQNTKKDWALDQLKTFSFILSPQNTNSLPPTMLAHNDATLENSMQLSPSRWVLLDWDKAGLAPPGFDLGPFLSTLGSSNRGMKETFKYIVAYTAGLKKSSTGATIQTVARAAVLHLTCHLMRNPMYHSQMLSWVQGIPHSNRMFPNHTDMRLITRICSYITEKTRSNFN